MSTKELQNTQSSIEHTNRDLIINANEENAVITITAQEIAKIITEALSSIKIYVVESDITEAQNRVKAVVETTSF